MSRTCSTRFDEAQYQEIATAAANENLSVSAWLHQAALEKLKATCKQPVNSSNPVTDEPSPVVNKGVNKVCVSGVEANLLVSRADQVDKRHKLFLTGVELWAYAKTANGSGYICQKVSEVPEVYRHEVYYRDLRALDKAILQLEALTAILEFPYIPPNKLRMIHTTLYKDGLAAAISESKDWAEIPVGIPEDKPIEACEVSLEALSQRLSSHCKETQNSIQYALRQMKELKIAAWTAQRDPEGLPWVASDATRATWHPSVISCAHIETSST